jgi:hypothetical protein
MTYLRTFIKLWRILPLLNGKNFQDLNCKPMWMTYSHAVLNVGSVKMIWIPYKHGVNEPIVANVLVLIFGSSKVVNT